MEQLTFNPSRVDETLRQHVEYYDNHVKVKDKEEVGETPELGMTSPEELIAMVQASDNPQQLLADIAIPDAVPDVDDINDQATLDSILATLAQNPDFDGNLSTVHGMVGELVNQVQAGLIDADSAQEQLVFNILELFDEGGSYE
ncbi:hypothetical protein AB4259_02675 [Vibrio amylolyticus]|uniref:hypothetical protein n=1 Tax=Vibrio amylolyticus TaxID=2847292 RepID=UPI003552418D